MATKLVGQDGTPVKYQGQDVYSFDYAGVVKGVDMERRKLVMVGTDETRDRDGDIIRLSGWKMDNYKKNPVFLWAHNYGSVPIARAEKVIKKKDPPRMEFQLSFPTKGIYPFADMILELYGGKFINTSSVGFIPSKWEPIPEEEKGSGPDNPYGRVYTSQELLELSGCAVPSNPNALQNALKGKNFGFKQDDLVKYLSGATLIPRPDKEDDVLDEIIKSETEIVDETHIQVQVPDNLVSSSAAVDPSSAPSIVTQTIETVDGVVVPPQEDVPPAEEKVDVPPVINDNKQEELPAVETPEEEEDKKGTVGNIVMDDIKVGVYTIMDSLDTLNLTVASLVEDVKGIQASLTKVIEEGQGKPVVAEIPASSILREAYRESRNKPEPTPKSPTAAPVDTGYTTESVTELAKAMKGFAEALKSIKL